MTNWDVLADGAVVGRIRMAMASLEGAPWLWRLAYRQHEDRTRMLGTMPPRASQP
jgi:hypothetical protein